jgi:hypothetical protein
LRRPLSLFATALLLLGTEVATGTVSLAFVRLWLGFQAVTSGGEFVISTPRYLIGGAILLAGVGVLVAILWVEAASQQILSDGSACPNCGTHTKRVRRRRRHKILSRIIETSVTRRRCERCGWNGLAAT